MTLLLNSDDGPSEHIRSYSAPGSSKWLQRKSNNTATISLPLPLSETIKYILHSDL